MILQKIFGLFLLQSSYSLLFSQQGSRYMKLEWNPEVTGWLFLSAAPLTYSSQAVAHWIASPLSLHLPQEKLWSVLRTNCYYSVATQNLSQIVYTAHKIVLIFNSPTHTMWKKTFISCLGSWSLVLLLFVVLVLSVWKSLSAFFYILSRLGMPVYSYREICHLQSGRGYVYKIQPTCFVYILTQLHRSGIVA